MDGSLTGTGDAAGDTFAANTVEVIHGTASGSDTLRGDSYAQTIEGFGGNDTIEGLGGNDTLNAGDGRDTLSGGAGHRRAAVITFLALDADTVGEGPSWQVHGTPTTYDSPVTP